MRIATLAALAAIVSLCGVQQAFALTVDDNNATNSDGSAKFGDPDDSIPFPHIADDGQPTDNNFHMNFSSQPAGNSGVSFGLTPSSNEPDAFQRAEQRMQQ